MSEERARKIWFWLFSTQITLMLVFWTRLNGGPFAFPFPFGAKPSEKGLNEPEIALWMILLMSLLLTASSYISGAHARAVGSRFSDRFPVRFPSDFGETYLSKTARTLLFVLSHVAPIYFLVYGWKKLSTESIICREGTPIDGAGIWDILLLLEGRIPFDNQIRLAQYADCVNYTTFETFLVPLLLATFTTLAMLLTVYSTITFFRR